MAKYYINKNSNSFGVYSNFTPKNLPEEWVEISESTYNEVQSKVNDGYTFTFDNGVFAYNKIEIVKTQEEIEAELRVNREPLLKAFDTYKTNLAVNIESVTEERWNEILNWYKDILDLESEAFEDIPIEVQYYLPNSEVKNSNSNFGSTLNSNEEDSF